MTSRTARRATCSKWSSTLPVVAPAISSAISSRMRSLGDTRAATGVGPPSRVGSSSKEPTPVGFYTSGWTPPPAKTGLAVWLEPGEQRIIYLTPDESEPLNFDFYPSDFACSARGPGGQVAVRPDYHHR